MVPPQDDSIELGWKRFAQSRDEDSFAYLFERSRGLVYSICYRILRDEEDAIDAMQAAYARLLASVADEGGEPIAQPILQEIQILAVREADNLRKRRNRRQRKEIVMETVPEQAAASPDARDHAAKEQLRDTVEQLVEDLPDNLRVPTQLYYFHEMTYQEIAEALEKSVGTIHGRIKKALAKLRPSMQAAGLSDAALALAASAGVGSLIGVPASATASAVYLNAQAVGVGGASKAGGAAAATVLGSLLAALKTKSGIVLSGAALALAGIFMLSSTPNDPGEPKPEIKSINLAAGAVAEEVPEAETEIQIAQAQDSTPESDAGAMESTIEEPTTATATNEAAPAAEDEEPPNTGPTRVYGRVVWEGSDAPVAGIRVVIRVYRLGAIFPTFDYGSHFTQTDAEGGFEFTGLRKGVWLLYAREMERNLISSYGIGDYPAIVLQGAGQEVGPVKLKVHNGKRGTVRVSDRQTKKPIAGAKVKMGLVVTETQYSDEKGEAHFAGVSSQGQYFRIFADGYGQANKIVSSAGKDHVTVKARLNMGGTVHGTVTDEQGEPIPRHYVYATVKAVTGPAWPAYTDAQGHYEIESVPVGEPFYVYFDLEEPHLRLYKSHPPYQTVVLNEKGERRKVNAVYRGSNFESGGVIEGAVTDNMGLPVFDAKVSYGSINDLSRPEARTDSEGRFRLANLPKQRLHDEGYLRIVADGYAAYCVRVTAGDAANPKAVAVSLEQGQYLKGRVVDGNANPIEHPVIVTIENGDLAFDRQITRKDGIFDFRSVPHSARFRFQKAGFQKSSFKSPTLNSEDVEIVLGNPGKVIGFVLDKESNEPIQSFAVHARFLGLGVAIDFDSADGYFKLEHLVEGRRYSLDVTAEGYAPGTFTGVEAGADSSEQTVDFHLAKQGALSEIAGIVRSTDELPREGIEVQIAVFRNHDARKYSYNWMRYGKDAGNLQFFERTLTAPDGSFAFRNVPLESFPADLVALGEGIGMTRMMLENVEPDDRFSIALEPPLASSLFGILNTEALGETTQIMLTKQGAEEGTVREFTIYRAVEAGQERYEIIGLPPGIYSIRTNPTNLDIENFDLSEGENKQVDLGFANSSDPSEPTLDSGLTAN